MRLACLSLLALSLTAAEHPEIGVQIAWPATRNVSVTAKYEPDPLCSGCSSQKESAGRTPAFGLSLRQPLTERFALRLTPAWQRVKFDYGSRTPNSFFTEFTTANRWDLPVIVEWRLADHIRPGIGPALSVITAEHSNNRLDVNAGFGLPYAYSNIGRDRKLAVRAVPGLAAAVEFPFGTRQLTIAPELRYTRWLSKQFGRRSQLDSLQLGFSIRFGGSR